MRFGIAEQIYLCRRLRDALRGKAGKRGIGYCNQPGFMAIRIEQEKFFFLRLPNNWLCALIPIMVSRSAYFFRGKELNRMEFIPSNWNTLDAIDQPFQPAIVQP